VLIEDLKSLPRDATAATAEQYLLVLAAKYQASPK
jgi:hypothetical protein